jgi:predicted permease
MTGDPDFTPRERISVEMMRNPDALFRRTLVRTLLYVVPSVALVVYSAVRQDYRFAVIGYAVLLGHQIGRLLLVARGLRTQQSILSKYEARLRSAGSAPTDRPSLPAEDRSAS